MNAEAKVAEAEEPVRAAAQDLDMRSAVVMPPVMLNEQEPVGLAQFKQPRPVDPQDPGCFALGVQ